MLPNRFPDAGETPEYNTVDATLWFFEAARAYLDYTKIIAPITGRTGIRQVDAGSCNGCELEIGGLTGPHYDLERFGVHFVASPRHADCLLVTGPVTRNMAEALRRTWLATPDPKLVIAAGDCAGDGGIFRGSYAVVGGVREIVPVDALISGCPPSPAALLAGLLDALGRPR